MPTQSTTYNSRVTDEALEKRFRDTFRSQGGAELVDDLYAQGVIVPVVDFTAAATGQQLAENLQTAWDFSTGSDLVNNTTTTIISNAGFWQIDFTATGDLLTNPNRTWRIELTDGVTPKRIWGLTTATGTGTSYFTTVEGKFVVFVNSGQSVQVVSPAADINIDVWYRQIATVNGDLVNPAGFTSS